MNSIFKGREKQGGNGVLFRAYIKPTWFMVIKMMKKPMLKKIHAVFRA
jgi:hypothetical protein